jgi:tRNA threonylcarbamoyladenosine biosynthesis protein TsaB
MGACALPFRAVSSAPMPSLRDLLATHAPLLVLDAASTRVQVGLIHADGRADWQTSEDEAGVAVFTCVHQLGINLDDVGAFVFCDGPGSILGIRTVAMAVRTWGVLKPRPVFAYTSLAVVAHAAGQPDLAVISDARRDSWHLFQIGRGLKRVPTAAMENLGALASPEGFRNWTPLPPTTQRVPYSLADLLPRVAEIDLFLPTEAPDAFLHEEPSYVTWTPHVHRAPAPR